MKAKNKFSFVILHYITVNDTIKCVDSIQKYCGNYDVDIVIVDNCSPNNSGEELLNTYRNSKNIKVIINKENLGFARGNNIGFLYSKQNNKPDFIVLCNNDTYLINDNFCEEVIKEYEKSNFAVMGPKIILKDKTLNNLSESKLELDTLKKQYNKYRLNYLIAKVAPLYSLKQFIKKNIKKTKKNLSKKYDPTKRYENIVLHGAFLIFSKEYINMFDGLDDRTFLYREEEFLYKRIMDNGLKSVYNPLVEIVHNEDSSTDAITKSNRKKDLFVCKNAMKSTKILINDMKEMK